MLSSCWYVCGNVILIIACPIVTLIDIMFVVMLLSRFVLLIPAWHKFVMMDG